MVNLTNWSEKVKELFCMLFILCLFIVAGALMLPIVIPVVTFGFAVMYMAAFVFIWLLPIFIIADSDKTTGPEKLAWILAIIFLSWFAWIFYFLLAPIKPRERVRYRHHHYYHYDY